MSQSEIVTAKTVDLNNCYEEPIHIPGSIQPHGILLVLKEPNLQILQVSNNTIDLLGIPPEELLNKELQDLIGIKQINNINQCLSENFESVNPIKLSIPNKDKIYLFDGVIHRSDTFVILDLEPSTSSER